MQETTVARSYAETLFELALTDRDVEAYAKNIEEIAALLRTEREFRLFLATPRIDPVAKKRVVREVFSGKVPDRLLRFLLVVIDKRRQRVLPAIAEEFKQLVNEHFGRLEVEITTASEPDEALGADLKQRLDALLGRDVLPRYQVNPRIIGGVIIKVGDRIMDGSVRHRLQQLRRSLLKAEV
jgi:F-type H+-transporting ATPase subunit delta